MHLSGKFWLFSLAVLLWTTPGAANCPDSLQQFLKADNQYELNYREPGPSVKFVKLGSDGFVTLRKFGPTWYSGHEHTVGTMTFQGDPRDIVYVVGSKVAYKLGIRMNEVEVGQIEMRIPGAEKFHEILTKTNENLKAKGLDPVTYHPTKAGFIEAKEALEFALSSKGDFLLNFPYDDNNPKLTVHEVSFHLGAIVLSKKITERTRLVNLRIQQAIDFIRENRNKLKHADALADKLLELRNLELDAGTGNVTVALAAMKSFYNHDTYSNMNEYINSHYFMQLDSAINNLTSSDTTPLKAVIRKLMHIKMPSYNSQDWIHLALSLDQFYNKYKHEEIYAMIPESKPGSWTREYLRGLDKRLEDIYQALP